MKRTRQNGYTLLEVILATSIALILLAALYTTLKLHLTTAEWGPRAAGRTQLARAISEQVRRDVSHLVLPNRKDQVVATFNQIPGQTQLATRYTGFRGDQRWIELYIDEPYIDTDRTSHTPAGISRIRYELTRNSRATASRGTNAAWSLTRSQLPAEFASSWDNGRPSAAQWTRTDVVSDEIAAMEFQFWDSESQSWVDSWEPNIPGTPPTALKMAFRLQASPTEPGGASNVWGATHTIVIQVASDQRVLAMSRDSRVGTSEGTVLNPPFVLQNGMHAE